MKDDILTTLAFSMYSNKGVYALLLGSGISRQAGIPTGWDVILDLIKKLAKQLGEGDLENPESWYREKYNKAPDYSSIISHLALKPTERVNLLRKYFEPTEEDRNNNLKMPTKAHKAIAELAKNGYIKVVITTNFDRLLETSLDDIGVQYQVISNESDIEGATVLVHAPFTILKVNGDYKDCRFKNTEEELKNYPDILCDYIGRIIDEFGLITCGWSASWDKGLINIINSSKNRRYSSFFTYISTCEESLKELADFRAGKILEIHDADSFFTELNERVSALESIGRDITITKDIAIARVKKYIVKPESIILLNDLFEDECNRVIGNIKSNDFASREPSSQLWNDVLVQTNNNLEILLPMCITAIRWSKIESEKIIVEVVRRITNIPNKMQGSFYKDSKNMGYYSRLELFYGIGITCVFYRKFSLLNSIFRIRMIGPENINGDKINILGCLNSWLIDYNSLNQYSGYRYKTPVSTILNQQLSIYFKNIMGDEYHFYFCIFEYLLGLFYNYIVPDSHNYGEDSIPYGEYFWRHLSHMTNKDDLFDSFFDRIDQEKDDSDILRQGMFDGTYSKYKEIKDRVDIYIKNNRCRYN
jgi:phosphoserine phosphatase